MLTSKWARLVGIKPVPIYTDMPENIVGPINASYFYDHDDKLPPKIGITNELAANLDDDGLTAVFSHEFGHHVQHELKNPLQLDQSRNVAAQRIIEDQADAISGILEGDTAYRGMQKVFAFTNSFLGPFKKIIKMFHELGFADPFTHEKGSDHSEDEKRLATLKKWSEWSRDKSDYVKRLAIRTIAGGTSEP